MSSPLSAQPVRFLLYDELDRFPEPTPEETRELLQRIRSQLIHSSNRTERKRARRAAARGWR